MKFDQEKFGKWESEQQIPLAVIEMVNHIAEKIGCDIEWKTIDMHSVYGRHIGYVKGFSVTHCTSSMLDGPSVDYSDALKKWLKGLEFYVERSFGDNGMDSATNWHDTYWTHEFGFRPSQVYDEAFQIWEDGKDYVD